MYGLLRIRLAAAITFLTRAGAEAGAIALPFTSRAFLIGLQLSLLSEMPPVEPVSHSDAREALGARAIRTRAAAERSRAETARPGLRKLGTRWNTVMPISFVSLRG